MLVPDKKPDPQLDTNLDDILKDCNRNLLSFSLLTPCLHVGHTVYMYKLPCRVKAAKYGIQKPSTCRTTWANLLRDKLRVWCKMSNKAKICCSKWTHALLFCNKFLQPATNVFVAQHVDHARWKTRNIDPKLAVKQCCATSWGFLYLLFCYPCEEQLFENTEKLPLSYSPEISLVLYVLCFKKWSFAHSRG